MLHLTDGNHYGWIRMSHYYSDTVFIEDYAYEAIPDSSILTSCIATDVKDIATPYLFKAFVRDHQLVIRFNQSQPPSQLLLLNDLGVEVNEKVITQSELVMDVSHLAAGIYFVAVDDGEKRQVKKIMIE